MKHYIIGSRLLVELFPHLSSRLKPNSDLDFLVETEPSKDDVKYFKQLYGNKTELHYIPLIWPYFEEGNDLANVLFTLKCSHVGFDKIHKDKTFHDIWLLNREGCKIIEPLYFQLYEYWESLKGPKWRADFTKESTDFFDDAVSRENEHDNLHLKYAFEKGKPAFKYLQHEGQTTVWVDPELWDNVSDEIRKNVIIEEAQVLSIERKHPMSRYGSYVHFLKGLVDRLAPLWMTVYILNNWDYFLNFKQNTNNYYEI